jgi:hypothetical protein
MIPFFKTEVNNDLFDTALREVEEVWPFKNLRARIKKLSAGKNVP